MAQSAAGKEPVYLTLEDALELFAAIVGGTPGEAAKQLRSPEALEGALARPATHERIRGAARPAT